jgi:flagellar hook-associated protein 2
MALSSPGIGSGLDVNSIVSQLVELERRPLVNLRSAATFIQTQVSAYGRVQSLVSALRDAAQGLARPSLWTQTTAGSSNPSAFTATASANAAPGSYEVQITQLARAHSLASPAFGAATDTVGTGRLTIEWGRWPEPPLGDPPDPATFTVRTDKQPLVIDFDDAATTLGSVRDRINAAKAGVTASIVRDANGARLTIRSDSTGVENAVRITATDLGGAPLTAGLAAFAYPPGDPSVGMRQTQAAANALATINGLGVESSSNRFGEVIDNVSFTAMAVTTAPATLTVSNDNAAQRKAVQDFVAAFNALNSYLVDQTKYDETNKIGGALQGDSTVLTLRGQLRSLLRETGGSGLSFFDLLSRSGDAPRDGTLTLDAAKLDAALADPQKLGRLFAGDGDALAGIATRFKQVGDRMLGTDGVLSARQDGLSARLKRNQAEQDRVNDRVERTRERLLQQYRALDVRLGQLTALSTYVNQQMTMLNNQFSASSKDR